MAIKFSNLASTTLASGASDSASSISVTSASLFPTLSSGDYFYASLGSGVGSEIVKVTGVSGTTFTVVRGQDDTTAISHSSGVEVSLRVTAASLNDLSSQSDTESVSIDGDTMTGNLNFGDNVKASFGSNDLAIFHDGSESYIDEQGTGSLNIRSSTTLRLQNAAGGNYLYGTNGGEVVLYHNAVGRLSTSSTGISVVGNIANASGDMTLDSAGGLILDAATGAITTNSTFDGRDVAADGTKLDGIEASADVTDTTNVTAAGALMDSEVTNLAQVKAFDSADYATAAQGTTADNALPKTGGAMTGAITTNSTFDGRDVSVDGAKLDGIAASANNYSHPSAHSISFITGLQTALNGKVDDSQVLTNVPSGAVFTDTTYSVQDGQLSQNDFTNADHTKLNGIEWA